MNAIRRFRLLPWGAPINSAALKSQLAHVEVTKPNPDRANDIFGKFAGVLAPCGLLALSMAALLCTPPLAAQSGPMASGVLQEKLASIKASAAENQRKLHQYTWTE